MSGFAFDANIAIDALAGFGGAHAELERAARESGRLWMSRVAWVEVMSKGEGRKLRRIETFLRGFDIDELDASTAARAAALRRARPRLKSPDAIILASAQVQGRILVTRNTRDFPEDTPGVRIPYIL